ncbi:MAG: cytochrome c oxidase accessory protein CcoG [Gammaproteobacteria bacterium]|nr:MAG: cytochrome c oxidase accessory protein CcoG [Gammaproteobacteria bacterium]
MEQPLKPAKPLRDEQLEQELYAKRQAIHPREVHGTFARLRLLGVITLLGIYYLLPWVTWEGRQAVLFDLPHRKFYIFDWVFWPQDIIFLAWLLIIAALALFFFTALAGRVWCGYACPQTVWTEVFLWLEHRIEGDRPKQIKLDRMPWNREKILKRGGKHAVWILFSLFTGFTFVGYFTPITELAGKLATFSTGPWETFWVLFYGFATYLNAGWMREQVCIYMCPYARFQGAMFDRDTLVIAYDAARGEPRGPRPRGVNPRELGLGDCIDCTICVQVCPTGIDIRDGLQYQCIACAACIDACDGVMEKMRYPKGLIRYTTENALEGKPTRIIRPRIVIYGMLLVALMAGFAYAISHRVPLRVDILRDRNTLYRETPEGLVENVYTLKVLNMDETPHRYRLTVSGIKGLDWRPKGEIAAPAGEVVAYPVQVFLDPVNLRRPSETLYFTVEAVDVPGLSVTEDSRFLGPVP